MQKFNDFMQSAQNVEVKPNSDGKCIINLILIIGSISFFWIDAHEIPMDKKGEIYLFGKVYDEITHTHVSATLIVSGLHR